MRKKSTSKILLLCLLTLLVMATTPALGSDWAKFQKNNYNTGVTADRAPVTNPISSPLSWNYSLGGNVDSAPVVAGDLIYVLAGNNHIYAFNKTAGGLVWEQSTSGGSGGFVIGTTAVGNGTVFVPTTDGKIFAFDTKTGSSKWNKTLSDKQIDTPITYSDGKIYFGEAMGGRKYYCLDEAGNEVWNRTATTQVSGQGSYYWAGAAVIGNSLVYGDDDGHLISLNKDTGANIAEINVSEDFGVACKGIRSSIRYVEELNRVYFTSTGGYCFALGFNPVDGTFNTSDKHSYKFTGWSTSTPSYYKGRIYMGAGALMGGSGSGFYCLDADLTGVIWSYPAAGIVQSSPAISTYYDDGDGEVYVYFTANSAKGGVYCLKDQTGSTSPQLVWNYNDSAKTSYTLQGVVISDGWIYFGTDKKYIFGLTTEIPLKANFTSNVTNGTAPLVVQFTDASSGSISSYSWDFNNDGVVDSNAQSPSYTYNEAGTYTVNLTVTGPGGSDSEVKTGYITVNEQNPPVPADAWYQFHKDAQHSGYTSSEAPDSANLAWTAEPLDSTYSLVPSSSVAIAEGKVFGLCNGPTDEYGNPLTDYGQIVAFDESTGDEIWNGTVSAPEWGSWSSPAYDSGKVFASAGKETYCVNSTTGDVIWNFHNPSDLASCNGGPSIGDGKVFVSDWDGLNYYCLDENTGALLWTFTVDGYAQATPSYKDGRVYLSSWSSNAVYCVNAATGAQIWKNEGFENGPAGSITITDDGLYVTVYSFGSSDGIYKLDLTDGHVIWGRPDVSPSDSTPTVTGGKVYLSAGTEGFTALKTYCLDASDGHTLWETNSSDKIGDWACSPAVADGKVFVGGAGAGLFTGCGELYALDAETGAKVWNYTGCGCSPAIADGMVFSVGGGKLYAFKEQEVATPEANFNAEPTSGYAPLAVQFTDKSIGTVDSYAWDVNNDGVVDSTEKSPSYTYSTPGTYTVNLTVTGPGGSDSEVKVGFIEVSKSLAKSYSTALNNTNPGAPDPAIPGFVGPAGDGKVTGNVVNPVFKEWASTVVDFSPANQSNSYTNSTKALGPVTGSNVDIVSLGDLTSSQILAGEKPGSITIGFNVPIANGEGPDLALFENAFMSGSQVFAELGYVEVSTDNITYVRFPAVSLTPGLVGAYGTIDPTNVTNLVGKHVNAYGNSWGTPFDLNWLENTPEVLNGSVNLSNINYVKVVDIPGNGTFRDSLGNPIYDAWPTYGSGGVDLEAVGVLNEAYMPLPVAAFSANETSGYAPLTVKFTDESSNNPTSWAWDFDNDGSIDSTEQNPMYTFNTSGTYTVNLTVIGPGGSDSEVKNEYIVVSKPVPEAPVADFMANETIGVAPFDAQFTDASTGAVSSYAWDFDNDGQVDSTEKNPLYTYSKAGTYSVNLTVANSGGSDSEIKTDYIVVSNPEIPDTTNPVIESAVLFPANTTAGSTINISVNATDNVEVTEVTAGDVQLTKTDSVWQGSITAPSAVGSYSLLIKAKDATGNTAETSVLYRVLQRAGGANIAVSPRSSSVAAGSNISLAIKVKNTQNIDDTFKVRISVSELPAAYQANLSWFDCTEKVLTLKAGQEVLIPIKVNVPEETAAGRKLFRAYVNSETFALTGYDTGYLVIS